MSKIALIILLFSLITINCAEEEKNDNLDSKLNETAPEPEEEEEDHFKGMDFSNVALLTDENYTEYIKKHDPVFLIIYATWCHHCQAFMPEFIKAANEKKFGVSFARIDGNINTNVSSEFSVQGFPTINLIVKGVKHDYAGNRNKDGILNFLDRKINGSVKKVESTKDLVTEGENTILLSTIVDGEKELEDSFNAYSEKNYGVQFKKCVSDECLKIYPKNDVFLLKSFDEKVNKFSDYKKLKVFKKSEDMIRDFFSFYGSELGSLITLNIIEMFFDFNKSVLFYFRESNNTEDTAYDHVMKEVGKELREKNIYTVLSPISGNDIYEETGEFFEVSKEELPALLFFKLDSESQENSKKYKIANIKPEQMTVKYIKQYLKDIEDGKILYELKSMSIPNQETIDFIGARFVVGKTFDKLVREEPNNVCIALVNRQYPCEICDLYLEVFKNLGHKYLNQTDRGVIYALMDGAANEVRNLTWKIEELPIVYLFTNAMKEKKMITFKPRDPEKISEVEIEMFVAKNLGWNEEYEKLFKQDEEERKKQEEEEKKRKEEEAKLNKTEEANKESSEEKKETDL